MTSFPCFYITKINVSITPTFHDTLTNIAITGKLNTGNDLFHQVSNQITSDIHPKF